jgi:hypothetical protein
MNLDERAKTIQTSRDIVSTIIDHGVNEVQKMHIISLLALELDNREAMIDIRAAVKHHMPDFFQETQSKLEV